MTRPWPWLSRVVLLAAFFAPMNAAAAPATHTLDVRLSWDLDVPVQFTMLGPAVVGQKAILSTTGSSSTIPGVTMGLNGQTGWFKVAPVESGVTYAIYAATLGNTCSPLAKVTIEFYYDGCLTRRYVGWEFSSCYQPEIGRYTPGDPCLAMLYLDADSQFDTSIHRDELPQFVPGSRLDGTAVPPTAMPQQVRLVAVAPKGVSGNVKFELLPATVSKFPGLAMNYPIGSTDVSDDLYFLVPVNKKKPTGEQMKSNLTEAPLSGGIAMVTLYVNDYGAWGVVEATIPTDRTAAAAVRIRIPRDEDGNSLPDAGWDSDGRHVSTDGMGAAADIDDVPAGQVGDGLSNYEEYRGFVLASTRVRTDPRRRDIFVVPDQQFYVGAISLESVLATLPFRVRYAELADVVGVDYLSRAISKGSAVVNSNRLNVPGSRTLGQRAVRLVMQTQYPAAVDVETAPGVFRTVPVSQAGIHGATLLESMDPERIDYDTAGNRLTDVFAESPDTTRWSEVYEQTFKNGGIATDFSMPFYYDSHGEPVPPCAGFILEGCDEFDLEHHLILPRIYPDGTFQLHAVPNPGDWYSQRTVTCGNPVELLDYGLSPAEMQVARTITGAHELGHSLHIDHTATCGNLMYASVGNPHATPPVPARSFIDIAPLPAYFSTDEIDQIQIRP